MNKSRIVPLIATLLLLPAAVARADCAYEIIQLKGKIANKSDKVKVAAVQKQINKATLAQPTSETECRNDVTRGWEALRAPPEQPARAPNTANLPNYSGPQYNTPNYRPPN